MFHSTERRRVELKHRPYLITMALATVLATAACGSSSSSGGGSGHGPVKVAVVMGQTGPNASFAQQQIKGINYAIAQINKAGGILGRKVQSQVFDTQSSPPQSIAAMRRAIASSPYVVMGTADSAATIVNEGVVAAAHVPQFTGSTDPAIFSGKSHYVFGVEPNSATEAQMFTKYIADKLGVKKLAFIYSNDAYGTSGMGGFLKPLAAAGVQVVAKIPTQVGQTDFSGALSRVARSGADAVFLFSHETEDASMETQINSMGLNKRMKVLGAVTALSQISLNLAKSAANGVDGFLVYGPNIPSMKATAADAAKTLGGVAPDANFLKAYIGMWAVAYATDAIGKVNQQDLDNYLHNRTMCVSKYPHLLGNVYWDANGSMYRDGYIVKIANGSAQALQSVAPPHAFAGCGG